MTGSGRQILEEEFHYSVLKVETQIIVFQTQSIHLVRTQQNWMKNVLALIKKITMRKSLRFIAIPVDGFPSPKTNFVPP